MSTRARGQNHAVRLGYSFGEVVRTAWKAECEFARLQHMAYQTWQRATDLVTGAEEAAKIFANVVGPRHPSFHRCQSMEGIYYMLAAAEAEGAELPTRRVVELMSKAETLLRAAAQPQHASFSERLASFAAFILPMPGWSPPCASDPKSAGQYLHWLRTRMRAIQRGERMLPYSIGAVKSGGQLSEDMWRAFVPEITERLIYRLDPRLDPRRPVFVDISGANLPTLGF